ncbi:uncharacterized protein LOC134290644 [Aedes albopictus]|uniref:Peptidase A2 domain-containing protein n=1 Tax=Aedes albopictus TaxID=7160 RepID=A0ABM1Y5N1_AEDAL
MTSHSLAEDCQRLLNLKKDTAMIQKSGNKSSVCAIRNPTKVKTSGQQQQQKPSDVPNTPCWSGGEMHYSKNFNYIQHQCKSCRKVGHKEEYCSCFQSKPKKNRGFQNQSAKAQGIHSVNQVSVTANRKFTTVELNGHAVRIQLDSAADISVISQAVYKQMGSPAGKQPSINVVNASGDDMGLFLELSCSIPLNEVSKQGRCFVSKADDLNLFGAEWIELFGLWDVPFNAVCNQVLMKHHPEAEGLVDLLIAMYSNVFDGSSKLLRQVCTSYTRSSSTNGCFAEKGRNWSPACQNAFKEF